MWPKHKAKYFSNLWDIVAKSNHSKVGIGFNKVDLINNSDYYLINFNNLKFGDSSLDCIDMYEENYFETTYYLDDF